MSVLGRLAPRSITSQITCIVIAAVLLGVGLASTVLMCLLYSAQAGPNPDLLASARAARIAAIVRSTEAAHSQQELDQVFRAHRWPSMDVEEVTLRRLAGMPDAEPRNPAFLQTMKTMLQEDWGITALPRTVEFHSDDALVVTVGDDAALIFDASPHPHLHNFFLTQTICAVAIVVFIIVFLSLYALRWITAPLSSIASAAHSFGRPMAEDEPLGTGGPREIAQVAEALNEMRKRIRTLVNERTQMLAAISHDLRTPLTRLRLRTERLADAEQRDSMLRDIATVNGMLSETLAYLREDGRTESLQLADLPSMLQTISAEFADIGFAVSYEGPDRLAFVCRVDALTRAVTNVVDNATKHGTTVTVALRLVDEMTAQIEVCDDGPSIPASLRSKVFEPFFKADSARPSSGGGFGLGLSIARDIVARHGGKIELLDNEPGGLKVRLTIRMRHGERLGILVTPEMRHVVDV